MRRLAPYQRSELAMLTIILALSLGLAIFIVTDLLR
jgi:hypothetical protein